jgi:GTP cyclohydrolase IA
MKEALRTFLKDLGENPDREDLQKTPERWLRAMQYCTSGYSQTPEEVAAGLLVPVQGDDLVIMKDIEFTSLCEHHLLPFLGKVHIGYLPGKHLIGLSKMPRIVDLFSRRLQSQERLGKEICEALQSVLKPKGMGVVIEARHLCVSMRGVRKNALVRTHHFLGELKSDAVVRGEFLHAIANPL